MGIPPACGGRVREEVAELMRIGMVCPYSFDVPGGVQSHVLQLADVMHGRGHDVSVLAPSSPHVNLPDYVVSAGKAVPKVQAHLDHVKQLKSGAAAPAKK